MSGSAACSPVLLDPSVSAAVSRTVPVGDTVATLDLPAGPYLRVTGIGVTVTGLGQSLTADVAVERTTAGDGTPVVYCHGNPTHGEDWLPFLERGGPAAP